MTMQAMRLGLNATIESFKHIKRICRDLKDSVRELEEQIRTANSMPGGAFVQGRIQARLSQFKTLQKVS